MGHLVGEIVATGGLIARSSHWHARDEPLCPAAAVGAYIGAAYWFTSSTSFANPAVTVGRMFSDTFAGINPASVPGFIAAQIVRALMGLALISALYPDAAAVADDVVVPHAADPPRPEEFAMTESPVTQLRRDLSIDQRHALKTAIHGCSVTDGSFGVETIEKFLHSSYDQFAERATVANFLPLLAERFARQRLIALAGGRQDQRWQTHCLFLCTHNAGRSQMALGFFNNLAGEKAVAWSGGSEPGHEINPSRNRSDG